MCHARLLSRLGSVVQSRSLTLDCMLQNCVTQASCALGSKALLRVYALALTRKLQQVTESFARELPPLEVEADVPFDVFAPTGVSPMSFVNDADHFGSKATLAPA